MPSTQKAEDALIESLPAKDRDNPAAIAEALEGSLHRMQKKSILYYFFPALALGTGGLLAGVPMLLWAAATLATIRTVQARMKDVPQLRDNFNAVAAGVTTGDPRPRAELKALGDMLGEDRQSVRSWMDELNPRKHYLRTPAVGLLLVFGAATGNPVTIAAAGFVMASTMLDQQGDYIQKIREHNAQARSTLRAWRTGLLHGR